MNKKLIIYTIAVVTITAVGASYASSRASSSPDSVSIPRDCQYPTRPLVNGRCDNTDPADPTKIKGEVKPKKKNVFIPEPPKQTPNTCTSK